MDMNRTHLLPHGTTNSNGHRPLRATVGTLASFIVVLLMAASSTSAATLNVVGGQLLGASGVIVDGDSYNVEFLDGTCIALYSGCDDVSDFTFQTSADALAASQALLDQVFLDVGAGDFDSDPELITGCISEVVCAVVTPWTVEVFPGTVELEAAVNYAAGELADAVVIGWFDEDEDTTLIGNTVYAVWTIVPDPGPAVPALTPLGIAALLSLTGLVGYRRLRA